MVGLRLIFTEATFVRVTNAEYLPREAQIYDEVHSVQNLRLQGLTWQFSFKRCSLYQ